MAVKIGRVGEDGLGLGVGVGLGFCPLRGVTIVEPARAGEGEVEAVFRELVVEKRLRTWLACNVF